MPEKYKTLVLYSTVPFILWACAPIPKAIVVKPMNETPNIGDSIPFYDSLIRDAFSNGEKYIGTTDSKYAESWFIRDAELINMHLKGEFLGTACAAQIRIISKKYGQKGGVQGFTHATFLGNYWERERLTYRSIDGEYADSYGPTGWQETLLGTLPRLAASVCFEFEAKKSGRK